MWRIFAGVVLGLVAFLMIVFVVTLPFAIFIVPGVVAGIITNSIGWGAVVSLVILILELWFATAFIIDKVVKIVRFIWKMTKLCWRVSVEMVEKLFA